MTGLAADPKPQRNNTVGLIVSGFSLLIIVSYAPFSIAVLLSERLPDFPLGFLVATAFFLMGAGTLFSAYRTQTGLIIAPAIGVASFAGATSIDTINTPQLLIATFVAGSIALLLSRPRKGSKSLRQEFLNALPRPVKLGVRGGVGALLAITAVHQVREIGETHRQLYPEIVWLFVAAVFCLLVSDLLQSKIEQQSNTGRPQQGGDTRAQTLLALARSIYVIVPLCIFGILYWFVRFPLPSIEWLSWPASWPPMVHNIAAPGNGISQIAVGFLFMLLILFVFLTDIPGSVYDLFRKSEATDDVVIRRIDQSFVVTSIMTMVSSVLGFFTSVYYAENHMVIGDRLDGEQTDIDDPWIAKFCGVIFILAALAFLFIKVPVRETKDWIFVSVSPLLFCLGVRMTARALRRDSLDEAEELLKRWRNALPPDVALTTGNSAVDPHFDASMASLFIPVSLTLILTHFVGLELAIPIGIAYYGFAIVTSPTRPDPAPNGFLLALAVGAAIVAGFTAIIRIDSLRHLKPNCEVCKIEQGSDKPAHGSGPN